MDEYDSRHYVGVDLHRRRSVIVRMTTEGQRLRPVVRIDNAPAVLAERVASWGEPRCGVGGDSVPAASRFASVGREAMAGTATAACESSGGQ